MKILVAEDDKIHAKILLELLSPYGEVELCVNGTDAMESFLHEESDPFDLVCLDINMPGLNGQEVLLQLRAFESEQGIAPAECCKVIMITSEGDPYNVLSAFREQCDSYLVKPVLPEKLAEVLRELSLL